VKRKRKLSRRELDAINWSVSQKPVTLPTIRFGETTPPPPAVLTAGDILLREKHAAGKIGARGHGAHQDGGFVEPWEKWRERRRRQRAGLAVEEPRVPVSHKSQSRMARGYRMHIAKVAGVGRAMRVCAGCGVEFHAPRGAKYHNSNCGKRHRRGVMRLKERADSCRT
jgi:hypothetical protein